MFNKAFIFITGAPRSGTSMIAKIIDAHPSVAILMENIFENRKRHWIKAKFWNDDLLLKDQIRKAFYQIEEPIIGNKVITPDVWAVEDIYRFCNFFKNYKIVFLVRNPMAVIKSRMNRELQNFNLQFNEEAQKNLLLDFSNRTNAYLSSWRQSIENYWKLKDAIHDKIYLIYYEDFCNHYPDQLASLFNFLNLQICDQVIKWYQFPHHNSNGKLERDLKYPDTNVFSVIPDIMISEEIKSSIDNIAKHYQYWADRTV